MKRFFKNSCLLSIIVPFFDTRPYIEECISSIINATEKKGISCEILLVDDNSTDGSRDIALDYSKRYGFIRYLSVSKSTRGPGHARNIGIDAARGEYIAFVDSDDIVVEDIYERSLSSLSTHSSDICVCDVSRLKKNNQVFSIAQNRAFSHAKSPCTTLEESPSLVFGVFCCNAVIRSSFLKRNGIRFPEDSLYEDFLYCLKIANEADRISIIRNVEYLWRVREVGSSITQLYDDYVNFTDRTEMNRQVIQYAEKNIHSPTITNHLYTKILMLYPSTMLSAVNKMTDEDLATRIKIMAGFFREYIPEEHLTRIPVVFAQTWKEILQESIEGVRRITLYRLKNYYNVPIIQGKCGFEILPNPSIIKIDRRDVNRDFDYSIPACHIRAASSHGDSLSLLGWLYFKRINVPEVGAQKVKAFLYNDNTGERFPIITDTIPAEELMKEDVSVFNYDDYSYYHYNYLGCGFKITLNLKQLLEDASCGKYLIMLEYDNPLKSGERVLRGMHKNAVSQLTDIRFDNKSKEIVLYIDPRQTPQIEINEK